MLKKIVFLSCLILPFSSLMIAQSPLPFPNKFLGLKWGCSEVEIKNYMKSKGCSYISKSDPDENNNYELVFSSGEYKNVNVDSWTFALHHNIMGMVSVNMPAATASELTRIIGIFNEDLKKYGSGSSMQHPSDNLFFFLWKFEEHNQLNGSIILSCEKNSHYTVKVIYSNANIYREDS